MSFPLTAKFGVALVGYGIVGLVAAHFLPIEKNPMWWLQEFGVIGGGAALIGWPLLSSLRLPKLKEVVHDDLPHITTAEQVDFEALNHLSERLKESKDKDGLDLCQKLSDRLFLLHHGTVHETT